MKKIICIILIVGIVLGTVSLGLALDYDRLTRGDFFELIAVTLGLSATDEANLNFPDYDNGRGLINSMINESYLMGRNDGTLSLDKDLSLSDVEYLLSRVDLTPKTIEKVEVQTEKSLVPVAVPLPVVIPFDSSKLHICINEESHLYHFVEGGYKCIYCGNPAAVGVTELVEAYPIDDCSDLNKQSTSTGHLDSLYGTFEIEHYDPDLEEIVLDESLRIGYNAKCFDGKVDKKHELGFAEMFRKYAGKNIEAQILLDEDGHITAIVINKILPDNYFEQNELSKLGFKWFR